MEKSNVFFDFVETYRDDIIAFINALKDWVMAIAAKINGEDVSDEESK